MKARYIAWLGVAVLAALPAGGLFYAKSHQAQLELGVGYAARVACACRYIDHRRLAACYADFEPGMAAIRLSDDTATKTVTASVPLIAHRAARYDAVLGCQPEPFRGVPLRLR